MQREKQCYFACWDTVHTCFGYWGFEVFALVPYTAALSALQVLICARVNAIRGPFWGERGLQLPSPILALSVYNMQTVSTMSRQCLHGGDSVCRLQTTMPMCTCNNVIGPVLGKEAFGPLPKYWHCASTTCRQCLQLEFLHCSYIVRNRAILPAAVSTNCVQVYAVTVFLGTSLSTPYACIHEYACVSVST